MVVIIDGVYDTKKISPVSRSTIETKAILLPSPLIEGNQSIAVLEVNWAGAPHCALTGITAKKNTIIAVNT